MKLKKAKMLRKIVKIIWKKRYEMKKVITYGTYDLLHYGHIRLLERAKALLQGENKKAIFLG